MLLSSLLCLFYQKTKFLMLMCLYWTGTKPARNNRLVWERIFYWNRRSHSVDPPRLHN